ncbi:FMN-binding negative transcriptional regulator [Corynebacterium lubricantis]|uniref:FMN-binding negative transcriptional regulator n=1 Tax=Corynebacterium lubricantis TaxID=541095 RepID=UPI0003668E18|nr:FMN-binding negative transcriptional regulator [Corynebacterium lubricantis]
MYVTNAYRMDEDEALQLASDIGVGQFISSSPETGLEATIMPFVLKRDESGQVHVQAHFAKVNRQWEDSEVMIIVQGPTAYVSGVDQPPEPDDAKMPRVPSLDYVAVHLKGIMRHRDGDTAFATAHLKELVEKFDGPSGFRVR